MVLHAHPFFCEVRTNSEGILVGATNVPLVKFHEVLHLDVSGREDHPDLGDGLQDVVGSDCFILFFVHA